MPDRERVAVGVDPLIGRFLDGGFRVVEALARSGLSTVYRAVGPDGAAAAVKVLHSFYRDTPQLRGRFEREAELAAKLAGRGAAAALGVGEVDERPYLVLELFGGVSLDRRLASAGEGGTPGEQSRALPVDEAIGIASSLLRALDRVHGYGVVHRDVKPSNLMILDDGEVKLIDFGMAAWAAGWPELEPDERTPTGAIGTPAYSAPEQINGRRASPSCDLYSVGVILFEMLSGERPFTGDPIAVLQAHLTVAAPRLRTKVPSLSPELEAVVARALEKRPADRFADATGMLAALAATPEAKSPPRGRMP